MQRFRDDVAERVADGVTHGGHRGLALEGRRLVEGVLRGDSDRRASHDRLAGGEPAVVRLRLGLLAILERRLQRGGGDTAEIDTHLFPLAAQELVGDHGHDDACDDRRHGRAERRRLVAAEPRQDGVLQGPHYDRDPLLRRLEPDFDFELDGSPPSEPLDELLDRLELLRPGELLEAVRRVPLGELAALERLPLRDLLPLLRLLPLPRLVPLRLLPLLLLSVSLRRLPPRLLCSRVITYRALASCAAGLG